MDDHINCAIRVHPSPNQRPPVELGVKENPLEGTGPGFADDSIFFIFLGFGLVTGDYSRRSLSEILLEGI